MFRFSKEKFRVLFLKTLCTMAVLCVAAKSYGQSYYSTNPEYIRTKTERNNLFTAYRYNYPDSSIVNEHNYFPANYMGNIGLPSPTYLFNYGTENLGFTFFQPPTQVDRFKENEIEYSRTKGPYAKLTGIAGSKQLQIFKMIFTATYKKVNVTLRFNRYTSQGFYLNQQTYSNNFYLSSNYTTTNKRFGYYFFIMNNSNKNQENGGIRGKTLNDSTVLLDKALLEVNISNANRTNSETKVMLNPWYRLNKTSDSAKGIDQYIQLKSRVSFNSFRYRDNNPKQDRFYRVLYLDTVTRDSSHLVQYTNEIDYAVTSANKKINLSGGYKNEINKLWQYSNSTFINHLLVGDLIFRTGFPSKDTLKKEQLLFETSFNVQSVFAGYNEGNYKAENNSLLVLNAAKKRELYASALFERRTPDYIYNHWVSNNFKWNNAYAPQEQFQLKAGVRWNKYISATLFYQTLHNYLYFDENALPKQYDHFIQNIGITLSYTNVFFKHLGVGLSNTFQSTSNTTYIRVPPNVTTAKLFFSGNLFRKNMQLQIGAQLQVYQSFYGYNYMPATEIFYLQNSVATGTYPYLDVYLNARIRPVSVFFKLENALQNLSFAGNNYSFVPGYYQPDMALRFGISWVFFD